MDVISLFRLQTDVDAVSEILLSGIVWDCGGYALRLLLRTASNVCSKARGSNVISVAFQDAACDDNEIAIRLTERRAISGHETLLRGE
jgi:hypothetical protein